MENEHIVSHWRKLAALFIWIRLKEKNVIW